MIIKGNTVGTTMPRANFDQTNEKKADYILGRENILPRSELNSAINSALTTAKESGAFDGKDGTDGKDGYTPQKGVDYFDGKDGYTPIKGVDYFDGKNGQNGVNGKDGKTPYIHNGYWYIDGASTGEKAVGTDGTNGKDGVDGKTPVKGTDYFTPSDKSEMVSAVIAALPVYDGSVTSV